MTRSIALRSAAALLAIAALTACGDAPAAPAASAIEVDLSIDPTVSAVVNAPADVPVFPGSIAPSDEPTASAAVVMLPTTSTKIGDTTFVSFSVSPTRDAIYTIGRHWIFFQAGAVCDPARSTYGEGYWNYSCPAAPSAIPVTAKVFADAEGKPVIEFDQHLRFSPTKYVILHMTFDVAEGIEPKILWFKKAGEAKVDESTSDMAMITRQGDQLLTYRRIKHFSGYTVSTGRIQIGGLGIEAEIELARNYPWLLTGNPQLGSGHLVATGAIAAPKLEQH